MIYIIAAFAGAYYNGCDYIMGTSGDYLRISEDFWGMKFSLFYVKA